MFSYSHENFTTAIRNAIPTAGLKMPIGSVPAKSFTTFSASAFVKFLAYSSPGISIFRRIVAPMLRLMSSSVARAADTKDIRRFHSRHWVLSFIIYYGIRYHRCSIIFPLPASSLASLVIPRTYKGANLGVANNMTIHKRL
nr:unnamed protein product [Callosobruchus analis]